MSNFWRPFFHFFRVKKIKKYFNRIKKLHKMALTIVYFFEKVEKMEKQFFFLGLKMPL